MGHYCGAPNRTKGGNCGRWLVNYDHCADHRVESPVSFRDGIYGVPTEWEDGSAATLANILTDGVDSALSDLVASYIGKLGERRLRRHVGDCQEIADAAKALADLGKATHESTGRAIGRALPPDTPSFVRSALSN